MAGGVTVQRDGTPRTVVGRVCTVLDAFLACGDALTLSDISRITGLPVSTTYRLVAELTAWGGLERTVDRRYRIGPRLKQFAVAR